MEAWKPMVESAHGELAAAPRWQRVAWCGISLALVAVGLFRWGRGRDRHLEKGHDTASIARREIDRKRAWSGGGPTTAEVVAYETLGRSHDDSATISVYVELEMTTLDGERRTVATGERVDEVYLTFLRPGALVPVRMSAQDPSLVAVEWWLAAWWPAPTVDY